MTHAQRNRLRLIVAVTVIVAVPLATGRTTPFSSTVAIFVELVFQL